MAGLLRRRVTELSHFKGQIFWRVSIPLYCTVVASVFSDASSNDCPHSETRNIRDIQKYYISLINCTYMFNNARLSIIVLAVHGSGLKNITPPEFIANILKIQKQVPTMVINFHRKIHHEFVPRIKVNCV